MKDFGELNYYLGMKITRSEEYIKLDQSGYVREILEKYSHLLTSPSSTTMCSVGKNPASDHEIGI